MRNLLIQYYYLLSLIIKLGCIRDHIVVKKLINEFRKINNLVGKRNLAIKTNRKNGLRNGNKFIKFNE